MMHNVRFYAAATSVLLIMMMGIGCGRKAMPIPPGAYIPPPVKNLEARLIDQQIVLSWKLNWGSRARRKGLIRFKVFRASRSLADTNDACKQCPPSFQAVATLAVDDMPLSESGALMGEYTDTPAPGFHYTYTVRGYTASTAAPPSNSAEVVYPPETGEGLSGDTQ